MAKTIQKSFRLTEEVAGMIDEICESSQPKMTQSELLEVMVTDFYSRLAPGRVDLQKEKIACGNLYPMGTADLEELCKKTKIAASDTNKKVTILLDLINSFITSGIIAEEENFASADEAPHPWVKISREKIHQKITEAQYHKHI